MPDGESAGREAASKERRRRRIVRAATELLHERGGARFTVEEVADRAEVSRRTVFNHFRSIDDLVVAVGAEMLGVLVDSLPVGIGPEAGADTRPDELFAELADGLRSIDLVGPMVRLTQTLGGVGHADPRVATTVQDAFIRITERLTVDVARRHPAATALEVDLLVSSLVGGVVVLYKHWSTEAGVVDDDASRRVWSELLDLLIAHVRDGYVAVAPTLRQH